MEIVGGVVVDTKESRAPAGITHPQALIITDDERVGAVSPRGGIDE